MYVCPYVSMFVPMYLCMYVCPYVSMYVCLSLCIHTGLCEHTEKELVLSAQDDLGTQWINYRDRELNPRPPLYQTADNTGNSYENDHIFTSS